LTAGSGELYLGQLLEALSHEAEFFASLYVSLCLPEVLELFWCELDTPVLEHFLVPQPHGRQCSSFTAVFEKVNSVCDFLPAFILLSTVEYCVVLRLSPATLGIIRPRSRLPFFRHNLGR